MLIFVIIYFLTLSIAWAKHSRTIINFLTVTNFIFLTLVFPKLVGYLIFGNDIFLSIGAITNNSSAQSAFYLIFLFVCVINIAYIIARPAGKATINSAGNYTTVADRKAVKFFCVFVIIPVSLASLGIYFFYAGVSIESLIVKRDWAAADGGSLAYISQKLAQFAKIGFLLTALGIISDPANSRKWMWLLVIFSLILGIVFLTSSQRSGVFMLLLQLVMVFQLIGKLKVKFLLVVGGIFLAANLLILTARFTNGLEGLNYFELFVRRYFFELEKIAGIFDFSVKGLEYIQSPAMGLFSISDAALPTYNVHYYIGTEVFGHERSGVPPSILGEIILYVGAIFVVPITFLMTSFLARVERKTARDNRPGYRLFSIVLLSDSYFLLLNSDILSLVKRLAFDTVLFGMALFFFYLIKSMVRSKSRDFSPMENSH